VKDFLTRLIRRHLRKPTFGKLPSPFKPNSTSTTLLRQRRSFPCVIVGVVLFFFVVQAVTALMHRFGSCRRRPRPQAMTGVHHGDPRGGPPLSQCTAV